MADEKIDLTPLDLDFTPLNIVEGDRILLRLERRQQVLVVTGVTPTGFEVAPVHEFDYEYYRGHDYDEH